MFKINLVFQHIGGKIVKLMAASISSQNVLIVAEETMLSVYRSALML